MRTREDAIRSTRRYVASVLGSPPWRVRLGMDARFKRPLAMVHTPIPSGYDHGGVDTALATLEIVVQMFPLEGDSPTESRMLAERAAEKFGAALLLGAPDAVDPTVRGYRELIPLWDYTDEDGEPLPLEGPDSVAVNRTERDYLKVMRGWTVQTQPEAPDDQLFVSIANLRVQWFRNARLRSTGMLLTDVEIEIDGS